jgi:hypothetical protein
VGCGHPTNVYGVNEVTSPSSAEVRNEDRRTSTSPCPFMVLTGTTLPVLRVVCSGHKTQLHVTAVMLIRPSAILTLDDLLTKFGMDITSLDDTQKSYVMISYNVVT